MPKGPKVEKRSADVIGNAVKVMRIVSGEELGVAQVVGRGLEPYVNMESERETAPDFYARISREYGTDVDLDLLIREHRNT